MIMQNSTLSFIYIVLHDYQLACGFPTVRTLAIMITIY